MNLTRKKRTFLIAVLSWAELLDEEEMQLIWGISQDEAVEAIETLQERLNK